MWVAGNGDRDTDAGPCGAPGCVELPARPLAHRGPGAAAVPGTGSARRCPGHGDGGGWRAMRGERLRGEPGAGAGLGHAPVRGVPGWKTGLAVAQRFVCRGGNPGSCGKSGSPWHSASCAHGQSRARRVSVRAVPVPGARRGHRARCAQGRGHRARHARVCGADLTMSRSGNPGCAPGQPRARPAAQGSDARGAAGGSGRVLLLWVPELCSVTTTQVAGW